MCRLAMPTQKTPGALITFCGLDGCGKSTILSRLEKELSAKGIAVLLTKQPTDFVRNANIFRTYMDSPDHSAYDYRSLSLLAASDRVQHTNKVIVPALRDGNVVLSDRYFYSCLANLQARGFEKDRWIYEVAESILKPDLAIFLDVPVETALARVRSRPAEKDRYIDIELQYRLREKYLSICQANDGFLVSTARSQEETYRQIWERMKLILEGKGKWNALRNK